MSKKYNSTWKMGHIYKLFCTYFSQEVIPVSISTKGPYQLLRQCGVVKIVSLSNDMKKSLTYVLHNQGASKAYNEDDDVSGEYSLPQGISAWDGFDKN